MKKDAYEDLYLSNKCNPDIQPKDYSFDDLKLNKLEKLILLNKMDADKMRDIDHRSQLGVSITKKEKEYFNEYYDVFLEELKEDYEHFKYHSRRLKNNVT